MNYMKTGLLLAGMTALFMTIGAMLGGQGGMVMALLFALGTNVFAWWFSDRMVLRMHGARAVTAAEAPELVGMVEELAAKANLPMPKVYIMETAQPNAFATGRNPKNAAVAATTGLMQMLTREELAGVMAHELAHIKNRDTLIMTITATIAGAISALANFFMFFGGNREEGGHGPLNMLGGILVMILAPMAAMLVQMAISRAREYEADRVGAEICGNPKWLADALAKIEHGAQRIDNWAAERNPATAHMFIINPLHAQKMDSLFSTHPNTRNRIHALMERAGEYAQQVQATHPKARRSTFSRVVKKAAGPWG